MATFLIYTDSALTVEFTGTLNFTQNVDGSTGRQDVQLWIGSVTAGRTLEAESNPGVDQITLSINDSAPGSGQPATDFKLALTQVGLDSAVGGNPLNLGTSILSGVGNAVSFWVGLQDSTHLVGTNTDVTIDTNLLRET